MSIEPRALEFFKQILATPSPSGYESPVQEVVRDYAASFADEMRTDVHGNVIAARNSGPPLRVMLAGHCDQIGLIVQHIDDDGFIYVQPIGGWDPQVLIGQRMTVWAQQGPVLGVIARKPIHLLTEEERKQVPKIKDLWLDIGAKSKDEAAGRPRRRPGDGGSALPGLRNGRAVSAAMDDKAGLWVVMEALRRADRSKLSWPLTPSRRYRKKSALRGAQTSSFSIDPQVGIAVDVTHATDCPTIEKKEEGDVRLGLGPVVYRGPNMNHKVVAAAVGCRRAARNSLSTGGVRPGHAAPTPTRSRSTVRAWPRRWSAFPTATCTVRWK